MAHPASPRGAPELNYNIKSVFDSQANTLPMCCFRRGRLELLKAEQPQLQPPPPPVDDAMAQRLVSALASVGHGDTNAADAVTDPVTILQFRRKSESEQLAFIDAIWNAISIPEPFTTPLSKMMDPVAGSVDGTGPLPSSLCPTQPGAATFQQRVPGQTFRKYGVGFRVEGSSLKDVIRLTNDGFNQQRFNFGFMCGVRGLRIDRTIIARQTSMARLWTGNHDTFNETAVCVSRNFFGATAFPLRTSDGLYYLWAVDCRDLLGCDVEQFQLGLRRNRNWRPGEKAYYWIPPRKLLGYTQIRRLGGALGDGWGFQISDTARWEETDNASAEQLEYMNGELAAWRGHAYQIPNRFDFAVPPDRPSPVRLGHVQQLIGRFEKLPR